MAGASREETFDVAADKYYAALLDYASYPTVLPEVDQIEILEFNPTSARIKYTINLIKSFHYVLKMTQKAPEMISWELESGSLFKKNSGHWQITPLGPERCKVSYSLDLDLKVFAPSAITNKLVAVNLPRMMQAFCDLARKK